MISKLISIPRNAVCLVHDRDQLIFAPFIHLPSRTLSDYYRIIKRPVSLKSAQKLVRGIKGRDPPTGSTFLKSWQAFEDEVSYIWKNARTYNEDGSAISELAGELEVASPIHIARELALTCYTGILSPSCGGGEASCCRTPSA